MSDPENPAYELLGEVFLEGELRALYQALHTPALQKLLNCYLRQDEHRALTENPVYKLKAGGETDLTRWAVDQSFRGGAYTRTLELKGFTSQIEDLIQKGE